MTQRENVIATILGKPRDHVPFLMPFGPWGETEARWRSEGWDGSDLNTLIGTDTCFAGVEGISYGLYPWFPEEVLERHPDYYIARSPWGYTYKQTVGHDTIPEYVDYPVRDWDSWLEVKKRLQPDPGRIDPAGIRLPQGDVVTQVGAYPYGLFGTARELIGVENLLLMFYDEPELLHDMFSTFTDLWLWCYEQVCACGQIDRVHIWEDMSGCHGPLISPAMMDEFMLPHYKRIRRFCDDRHIPIFSFDSDGDITLMLPFLMEAGVNLIEPWEVAAGNDVVRLKQQYPTRFCPMGGIDKRDVALGREAIDAVLARIEPALDFPCIIPALDHLFHPEISFPDFLYFNARLKAMCHKHR